MVGERHDEFFQVLKAFAQRRDGHGDDRDAVIKVLAEGPLTHGAVIYYVGPTPAKPGEVVGSAGPTTSGRMDKYTPTMIEQGMRGMIGKGLRSQEVIDACAKHGAVYFVAVGGAAAVITQSIKNETMIAYEDLGPEAIRRYEVKDFPAIVCIDSEGNDFYKVGIAKYKKE